MCGEAPATEGVFLPALGPSPRVRGSLGLVRPGHLLRGSIPACAGKPGQPGDRRGAAGVHPRVCGEAVREEDNAPVVPWVHPRVCGEATRPGTGTLTVSGPSLRVRGSPGGPDGPASRERSIPACAGKPSTQSDMMPTSGVHPRVCGEAHGARQSVDVDPGPSPRVRGSRQSDQSLPSGPGSIPACAGKPTIRSITSFRPGVHPRVCGEASGAGGAGSTVAGPSPRVRGSQRRSFPPVGTRGSIPRVCGEAIRIITGSRSPRGSIPACAGKPESGHASSSWSWVHPRVCGEALSGIRPPAPDAGPSPRVRGSRVRCKLLRTTKGSIPACAGKPMVVSIFMHPPGVHPRVCGEAPSPIPSMMLTSRSIPACAGKPRKLAVSGTVKWVHPRVCGEATPTVRRVPLARGPSPRVRGSRIDVTLDRGALGSIPACAGKPRSCPIARTRRWVHPRVCGEATAASNAAFCCAGPSPRVRGSPDDEPFALCSGGSIPACAGKPPSASIPVMRVWVHPRVCGEATLAVSATQPPPGPSPRVRGSHSSARI